MGSQTRKLRARGALDSSSDLTKAARVGRRRKRGRSNWKRPAIKLINSSETAWSVFDDVVRQSDDWTRQVLAQPPPLVAELPAPPGLRLPTLEPGVVILEPRNEPLERLQALQLAQPELVGAAVASLVPIPGIHHLAAAATAREEEIVRQRHVEKLGGVVLADGSAVPREEAVLVDERWVPLPRPAAGRSPLLAALVIAALGVAGGDVPPPRGRR